MKNDSQTLQLQYAYRLTLESPYPEQASPVPSIIRNLSMWAIPHYPQERHSHGYRMLNASMLADDVMAWCQQRNAVFILPGDKVNVEQPSTEHTAVNMIASLLANTYAHIDHTHDPVQLLRSLEQLIKDTGGLTALIRYRYVMLASLALEVSGYNKDTRDSALYARAAARLPADMGDTVAQGVDIAAHCLHEASQQLFLK